MLYIKTDNAIRVLGSLGLKLSFSDIAKAESRAINHTLSKARTEARTDVKKVYNISQRYLDGVGINRANVRNLRGELFASHKPIPLDAFGPKQQTGSSTVSISKKGKTNVRQLKRAKKNPTAGVSIQIFRGQTEVIPFAFLLAGGKARVFARGEYRHGTDHGFIERHHRVNKEGSDTPIKPLISISVFGSIVNKTVMNSLVSTVKPMYKDRLVHEIRFIASEAARASPAQGR